MLSLSWLPQVSVHAVWNYIALNRTPPEADAAVSSVPATCSVPAGCLAGSCPDATRRSGPRLNADRSVELHDCNLYALSGACTYHQHASFGTWINIIQKSPVRFEVQLLIQAIRICCVCSRTEPEGKHTALGFRNDGENSCVSLHSADRWHSPVNISYVNRKRITNLVWYRLAAKPVTDFMASAQYSGWHVCYLGDFKCWQEIFLKNNAFLL